MPTYRYNGKKITSTTPLTDEQLEEAFKEEADINTDSPSSGTSGASESKGGGFFGRVSDDVHGIANMATGLPGALSRMIQDPFKSGQGFRESLLQGTSEQIRPFLPPENNAGSLGRFLGGDPLKGAQAALAAIPGMGRTVQSGQDLSEGREGAGGELAYDSLMALSPKIAPKVNAGLDAVLDPVQGAMGAARRRIGSSIEGSAIRRLDNMPEGGGIRELLGDPDLWKKRILAGGAAGLVGADPSTILAMALAPDAMRAVKTSPTIARGQARIGELLAGAESPRPLRKWQTPDVEAGPYDAPIGPEPAPNQIKLPDELWNEVPESSINTNVTGRNNLGDFEPLPYENLPSVRSSTSRRVPGEDIPTSSRYPARKAKRSASKVSEETKAKARDRKVTQDPAPDNTPSNPFTREYVERHGGSNADAKKVWDNLDEAMKDKLIKNPKYRARFIRTVNRRGSRASGTNPRTTEEPHQASMYEDPIGPSPMPDDVREAFERSKKDLNSPMTEEQMNEGLRSILKRARRGDKDAVDLINYLEEVEARN